MTATDELNQRIAQLEEAQAGAELLYHVSRGLTLARDENELLHVLSEPAREAGAFRGILAYTAPVEADEPEWVEVIAAWQSTTDRPPPAVGTRFSVPDAPIVESLQTRLDEPLLVADILTDPRIDATFRGQIVQMGFRAMAILPLVQAGRWHGIILFGWDEPHQFGEPETDLYDALNSLASPAVENRYLLKYLEQMVEEEKRRALTEQLRATEALEESEARFRTLVETAPSLLMITDPQGNNAYVSPNCEEILGYTQEELQAQIRWWVHPDDTPRAREVFERTFREGTGGRGFEYKAVRKDGEIWFASSSWEPLKDPNGEFLGVVMQTIDVTERRRAEEEIRRHAETLTALHETALDLAEERALPDLLRAILSRGTSLLPAQGGGIYLYRPETDDVELVSTLNETPGLIGTVLRRGEGLCGKVFGTGRPIVVDDYYQWPGRSERFGALLHPASVAVPILWADRPMGVLYLCDNPPRVFSADDVAFLERFAPLAGAALENARLLQAERARRHVAETLQEASTILNSTLELEEVLDLILEQLAQVVPFDTASVQRFQDEGFEIVGCRGFEDPGSVVGLRFPLSPTFPNSRVVESKAVLAIDDVAGTFPHFAEEAATYSSGHIRSWLGVPLVVKDRVIGMIALDRASVRPYTKEETDLALAFANQAAVAIENARLYRSLQDQMEQLQRTQTQLVQSAKLAAIGELAAGVAHELNNPLTAVLGFAELLLEGDRLDSAPARDVEAIVAEARRARQIVRHLLDFARQTKPLKTPTDVNQVLWKTLAVIREHLETSGVEIVEEYSPEVGQLLLDEGQIRQVLLNLITNAVQAMPSGGQLSIGTARIDDQVAISIADTGVGMTPEVREHVFEPFFTTNPAGTGLGLAVSLGFAEGHGGHITVESEEGRGSTFTVWLPVSPAEGREPADKPTEAAPPPEGQHDPAGS